MVRVRVSQVAHGSQIMERTGPWTDDVSWEATVEKIEVEEHIERTSVELHEMQEKAGMVRPVGKTND